MRAADRPQCVNRNGATDWPDALISLYRSTYRNHTRLAYAMIGSAAEAEEIVQESFVVLLRNWNAVESPGAYLRRTVSNKAIDVLRRRKTAGRYQADPPPPGAPDQLVELRDCLLRLPDRQRAAVVLRYVEGLDDSEIAAALKCREGTVRSLISRGLSTLRSEVPR